MVDSRRLKRHWSPETIVQNYLALELQAKDQMPFRNYAQLSETVIILFVFCFVF